MFGKGISKEGDILDLAVGLNLVNRAEPGLLTMARRSDRDVKNAKKYLAEHPEIMETLDHQIREHYHFGQEADEKEEKENRKEAGRKS